MEKNIMIMIHWQVNWMNMAVSYIIHIPTMTILVEMSISYSIHIPAMKKNSLMSMSYMRLNR